MGRPVFAATRGGDPIEEILQRTRRTETRLTQLMIAMNVETQAQKASFYEDADGQARILVPSRHTPLKEILDSIPDRWQGMIDVYIGVDRVLTIDR